MRNKCLLLLLFYSSTEHLHDLGAREPKLLPERQHRNPMPMQTLLDKWVVNILFKRLRKECLRFTHIYVPFDAKQPRRTTHWSQPRQGQCVAKAYLS